MDTHEERILLTAYALGHNRGERCYDVQNLWGGRVTRKGEAEANAVAFLKAREEGDGLDWISDQPLPYAEESDTLAAVRLDLGGSAVVAWMNEQSLNEEQAAERIACEWMMGYTDGILDALEASAQMFLETPEA
jgi:hypothetical protein